MKATLNKALRIKAKYKCFSVGKPCFIEGNYTILTLKTAPINTSAVEALCYCWKRIPEQKHWIQVVISTSQDTSWYVAVKVTPLQLDFPLYGVGAHTAAVFSLRSCECVTVPWLIAIEDFIIINLELKRKWLKNWLLRKYILVSTVSHCPLLS